MPNPGPPKIRSPFALLVRKTDPSRWDLWSQHGTLDEAHKEWATKVAGKGICAWAWWGPSAAARKMLLDPNLTGDEDDAAEPPAADRTPTP